MTDTIREQIMDALEAALGAVGKPTGLTVSRFPVRPTSHTDLPVVVLLPLREEVSSVGGNRGPVVKRLLRATIEARAAATGAPDSAVDPLVAWITATLQANPTLSGKANGIREVETSWVAEADGDGYIGVAVVEIEIEYQTKTSAQTARV